jgi:hypothetical protein
MSADLMEPPADTSTGDIRKPPSRKELALEEARRALYTGAAIRSDTLVIATVKGCSLDGFELCLDKSAQIELEDRDQEALHFFKEDLETFIREAGITRLLLRGPPKTGKFRTGLAFKVEAVLQLVPGLEVEVVHFNRVDSWSRSSSGVAPAPISGLVRWEEEAHRSAIATACFGEMYAVQKSVAAKLASSEVMGPDEREASASGTAAER